MLLTAYKVLIYYGSLALFGVAGCVFGAACWLSAPFGGGRRRERLFQRAIQREFAAFVRWLAVVGIIRVSYRGFERMPTERRVVVANHPGLLDAVLLLARVPAGFCIFKPAIGRNPVLGPAARRAGYLPSDRGLTLVRRAAANIAAGATLVVFPEGTRTPAGGKLGAFRPGFALIARCAGAPVQLVRITSRTDFLTKERACWKLPALPADIIVEAGPCFDSRQVSSTSALVEKTEAWFRQAPVAAIAREPVPMAAASPLPPLAAS